MKKILLAFGLLASAYSIKAQTGAITLLTFESFTFADKFQSYYGGYGQIGDAFQWGGGLEFGIDPNKSVELIYQRMDADVYYDGDFSQRVYGTAAINYILLGATGYAPVNDVVSGFGTFDMGVGFTSNLSGTLNSDNVTKFALGGRLGVRIAPSDKISIRLHAQLLSPVQWIGGGYYFGTGGSGASVSTGSTVFQFNLGGSVNYRLR
jgi:hypothetical protein